MKATTRFQAPWGRELTIITAIAGGVCVAVPIMGIFLPLTGQPWARLSMIFIPLLILAGSAPFAVRGYTIENGTLIIHRLGWVSRVDLSSLRDAEIDPHAMKGSMRVAGNGGLFAFCGWFRSRKLGMYRAFSTDLRRGVILRFPNRVVVVTPDAPEEFVRQVKAHIGSH